MGEELKPVPPKSTELPGDKKKKKRRTDEDEEEDEEEREARRRLGRDEVGDIVSGLQNESQAAEEFQQKDGE